MNSHVMLCKKDRGSDGIDYWMGFREIKWPVHIPPLSNHAWGLAYALTWLLKRNPTPPTPQLNPSRLICAISYASAGWQIKCIWALVPDIEPTYKLSQGKKVTNKHTEIELIIQPYITHVRAFYVWWSCGCHIGSNLRSLHRSSFVASDFEVLYASGGWIHLKFSQNIDINIVYLM